MIRPRQLDQPRHLSTSDCNHEHAKFDKEKELTAYIRQKCLCDCEDCNLRDWEECNTKEEDTREIERHNKDNEGAILSGTLYRNSTYISEVSTGNTEQDSNTGDWYKEDGDSVILSKTLYNESIHTSGEDRNDTGPNNSTLPCQIQ